MFSRSKFAYERYLGMAIGFVFLSFVASWMVLFVSDRVTIDFSPGRIEKWLGVGAAFCLIALFTLILRSGKKAICLLLPLLLSLNFVLVTVGIREDVYLANNQIGYRPWILICDFLLMTVFLLGLANLKVGQINAFIKASLLTGGLFGSYILMGVVSLIYAQDTLYVWLGLVALARFLVWFIAFLLIFTNDIQHIKYVTWGLAGFVTLQFMIGLLQAFRVPTVEKYFEWSEDIFIGQGGIARVGGTMGRAHLESILLLIVPVLFAYASSKTISGRQQKLMMLCGSFGIILVFLTGSRGPIISTILGTAVALRLFRFFRPRKIHVWIWFVLGLVTIAGLIIIFQSGDLSNTFLRGTHAFRLETFEVAVRMVERHPLTGVGLNNYLTVGPIYGMSVRFVQFGRPVHNQFLLAAAETGIIGLLIFLLNLLYWGWLTVSASVSCRPFDVCWFPKGVQGSLVAFFLTSLLDAPLVKPPVISVLAILIAGVSAVAVRRVK
ncbi:MAG: O-antigen ligase family protein [Anaerolineae bacterium]|nr:O-antigen ligase family protein [Anaerolineae bacterium]